MATGKLVGLLALAPFEALYGLATGSVGALVASSLLYAVLPLLAAAAAFREGVAPRARILLAVAGAGKALLVLTTPSEPLHYSIDTLAVLAGALVAFEEARGPAATIALLATAAGAGLVAVKHLAPGLAEMGLTLQVIGLLAAWAALESSRGRGRP